MEVIKDKIFVFRTNKEFRLDDFASFPEGTIDVSSKVKSYIDVYKINTEIEHAYCWDIITPHDHFEPMLVIGTFLEPRFMEQYESGKITKEALHNMGTGYVDCAGSDGYVQRLQYYEYYPLRESEGTEKYKKQITSEWECENIEYYVGRFLQRKAAK